jgi:ribonuclease BN (tRNA processing enzyme)
MRLTVLGCSGSFPGPEAACSSYLVEAGGFRLLLDLGNGALGALQRYTDPYQVDAVVLSHLHPDHCIDLCSYYVMRRYRPDGPVPARLPVYAPAGAARRMARAYDLPPGEDMGEVFDFRVLGPGSLRLGPFLLRAARVNHPVETYALRLEHEGSSLTYSGDTGECAALVELATGTDLLLCEASFQEGRETVPDLHLTGRQAADHARLAVAGHLLLTHIPPWTDPARTLAEARENYFGPVALARPGGVHRL